MEWFYIVGLFFGFMGTVGLGVKCDSWIWPTILVGGCWFIGYIGNGWAGAFWTWAIVMSIIGLSGSEEDSPSTGTAYVNGKAYNLTERKDK